MPEQPKRSTLSRIGWFLKIFIPALVVLYIIVFFAVNRERVDVEFLFAQTNSTVRPVIVVSMVAGCLTTLLAMWTWRLMTRRH